MLDHEYMISRMPQISGTVLPLGVGRFTSKSISNRLATSPFQLKSLTY